jgi:hypothetical protein
MWCKSTLERNYKLITNITTPLDFWQFDKGSWGLQCYAYYLNYFYGDINNPSDTILKDDDIELSEDNIYQINYFNNKVYIQFTKKQLCIYYMLKIFKVIFLTNKLTIIAQYIINLLKIIFFFYKLKYLYYII